MATISAVIVNYNGAELLQESLDSLVQQRRKPAEVILVDNASSDNSVDVARRILPDITIIQNQENCYFAAGANQGIAAASGEFILILNNDCALAPDYLEILAAQLERNEPLGAAVGKIFRRDRDTLDQAGQMVSRTRTPLDRGYGLQDAGDYDEPEAVLSCGGVAPLIRRSMLNDIRSETGWFDEDFVHFYEDLDLFWRAHNLGWRHLYHPDAEAVHYRGATSQIKEEEKRISKFAFANLPLDLQQHLLRNRYETMAKNDDFISLLASSPFVLYYESKIFVYTLLLRPALFPGWIRSFSGFWRGLKKRKELKEKASGRGSGRYGSTKLRQE